MRDYINMEIAKLIRSHKTRDPFQLIKAKGINLMHKSGLGSLKGFYYISHRERYIIINADLEEREQLLVAAHELGHDILHRHLAGASPMRDFQLYDMTSRSEYEANMFASELLIDDKEIEDCMMEELDFFSMCSILGFRPEIVTFKLHNMMQRGYQINMPQDINSRFLG